MSVTVVETSPTLTVTETTQILTVNETTPTLTVTESPVEVIVAETSPTITVTTGVQTPGMGARIIANISSNTTARETSLRDYIYYITGNTTLTLPTAVGNTNRYTAKCVSGITTVACNGVETIDGTSTIIIGLEDSVDLLSNGTEWKVV